MVIYRASPEMHPSVFLLLMAFCEALRLSLGHSSVLRLWKASDLVHDVYESSYYNLIETTIAPH